MNFSKAVCLALALALPALAQVNPAARGPLTYPRYATGTHAPLQVTEVAASGLSPFSPTCGDAGGGNFVNSEVEPHIAVNPRNPNNFIGTWQQDRYDNGGSRGVLAGVSFDGGATWALRSIPNSNCTGGSYARSTDPWVSFGPDGTAHQVVLSFSGQEESGTSAVLASRSTDGGLTWSAPASLIQDGAGFFNDKETITADPYDPRFVYAVWDRLSFPGDNGPTMFARSTDGGLTWEAARAIYNPGGSDQSIGNLVRVLPDGTLVDYLTIFHGNNVSLNVIRSTNRGISWSAPVFISPLIAVGASDPTRGTPVRDGSILPQMAVGPDGTLHVVWQDARFNQHGDAIAYSRSTDGGFTWSAPVRVSASPAVAAFTPQIVVRDDGLIGVTYYDFRSDTPATPLLTDFWLTRSTDGLIWTETRVSPPFDLNLAPNVPGLFLGDYTGLATSGSSFIAFYARTNALATNRTDIIATRLAPGSPTAPPAKSIAPALEEHTYRAAPLPEGEPGRELLGAAQANLQRSLAARLARLKVRPATAGPPPDLR
jgi:hypothetical protein